ncbi:hypothetical protein SS1G_02810 [Sclerotinia sclerotiorum 1980 UF-70]|uniref:Basic proline-rich protein n=1 Tax=Sclerotinia sclerotiorum (strain ATCC 18683 / 1980 / Ss-1) TaxID=665079 RepID=A7EBX4_SCLS1|nr:hypothetical protein SS1G_02810 [Sclerotinia sclerotiorum 1980 UF-70]EDN99952.1 hypothetical protein SS1G_02810 [Sclerotinia sclerotiorum 1980 UF-70]
MEPVPELHSLEEFRASPVPRLRLQESALYDTQNPIKDREQFARPQTLRRTTEPIPQSPRSPGWSSPVTPSIPFRPRNTSPYARGHFRSRSNGSVLAPPMSRAQSLPGVNGAGHLLMSPQRPASPLGSPARVRIPRKPADEVFPGFPNRALINISEGKQPAFDEDTSKMSDRSASPILGIPSNEEAAIEADRIAQLKAAADAADGAECEDAKSRGLDTSGGRGRGLGGFGSRDKRKRWSVCGAERRGDLNLDTIWED